MTTIIERMAELGLTNHTLAALAGSSAHKVSAARTGRYISGPLAVRLSEALGIDVQPCGSWEQVGSRTKGDGSKEKPYPYTCTVCGEPSFRERCVGCLAAPAAEPLTSIPTGQRKTALRTSRSDAQRAYEREYSRSRRAKARRRQRERETKRVE